MNNIAIILGYGVYENSNVEYFDRYLSPVFENINSNNFDPIVICGGCTNKKYPNLSESKSIYDLYRSKYPNRKDKVILEEKSYTTSDNLKFAHELIAKYVNNNTRLTVFCDSWRSPKVFYMSLSQFIKPKSSVSLRLDILNNIYMSTNFDFYNVTNIEHKNLQVIGYPLSNDNTQISQQIMASMIQMNSYDYPKVNSDFIKKRKQIWGIK